MGNGIMSATALAELESEEGVRIIRRLSPMEVIATKLQEQLVEARKDRGEDLAMVRQLIETVQHPLREVQAPADPKVDVHVHMNLERIEVLLNKLINRPEPDYHFTVERDARGRLTELIARSVTNGR